MKRLISITATHMPAACLALIALCLLHPPAKGQTLVDQIVTLVNDEIITRSDLLWSLALDARSPSPAGAVSSELLRQKLDIMIDQRLIAQEATKVPGAEVTPEEIDKKRAEIIARFPSEAAFRERVQSVGLTPERIDLLLREMILIEKFIGFRFQAFVFVTEQEIERYYNDELVPKIRKEGQVPPPLDQVRDMIKENLRVTKVNEEMDRYLTTARQRADIVHLAEL
ncbi:MAG TPA: hypothetical protein VNH22_12015 [Blastocatellia bacterium]|nr:hypothetical protein [Blastocatellia bacterium]